MTIFIEIAVVMLACAACGVGGFLYLTRDTEDERFQSFPQIGRFRGEAFQRFRDGLRPATLAGDRDESPLERARMR